MSTFVLIHGAWHGGWCWYKVTHRLQEKGHHVIAPDLHGLGIDKTPMANVSLNGWVEQVSQILDEQSEPVILVGHSRAGIVISQVAEERPEKVRNLIWLIYFCFTRIYIWNI